MRARQQSTADMGGRCAKLLLCLAVACGTSAAAATGRGQARYTRKSRLPDPSYLTLPEVEDKMRDRGLIYEENTDLQWSLLKLNESKTYSHYCPEVVYLSMVVGRHPTELVHRKCDENHLRGGRKCLVHEGSPHSHLCMDQAHYIKVKVNGTWMYQKVYNGCVCDAKVLVG